jgi:tetratricopeptide (TPR) repeat protein
MRRALVQDYPSVSIYQEKRSRSANSLGFRWHKAKEDRKAIPLFEEAIAGWQELINRFPAMTSYRDNQARAYRNVRSWVAQRKPAMALKPLRQALAISTKLMRDHPQDVRYREDRANDLSNLAGALVGSNTPEGAAAVYDQAIQQQRELARDFPRQESYRRVLLNFHLELVILLTRSKLTQEGEKAFRRALEDAEKAVKDFPIGPGLQSRFGRLLATYGYCLLRHSKDAQAARALLERAISLLLAAGKTEPDDRTPTRISSGKLYESDWGSSGVEAPQRSQQGCGAHRVGVSGSAGCLCPGG